MSLIVRLEEQLGRVKLEGACFCLPLRTGSIVLGCLSLIGGILIIAQAPTVIPNGGAIAFSAGLRIFLSVFWIIAAVLLLWGIHTSDPVFMLPYIFTGIIQLFGGVLDIILCVVTLSFLTLGGVLIILAIQIYFFFIVSSYYMELRHGTTSPSNP